MEICRNGGIKVPLSLRGWRSQFPFVVARHLSYPVIARLAKCSGGVYLRLAPGGDKPRPYGLF